MGARVPAHKFESRGDYIESLIASGGSPPFYPIAGASPKDRDTSDGLIESRSHALLFVMRSTRVRIMKGNKTVMHAIMLHEIMLNQNRRFIGCDADHKI
jgi:hypothetical protein